MNWTKTNAVFALAGIIACSLSCMAEARAAAYRSPLAVAVSPDGKTVYVSDKTAKCVTVLDVAGNQSSSDIPIPNEPNGLALSADGKTLYVAERKAHAVALIDAGKGAVSGRIAVGLWPVAVALAEKGKRLYTCNQGDHTVSVVDLAAGKEIKRIPAVREPSFAAVSPDESRVVVANLLPYGAGIPGELRIFYLPPFWTPPVVKGIEKGASYRAFLFNPSNGVEVLLGAVAANEQGDWPCPKAPIFRDWVLVLERAR